MEFYMNAFVLKIIACFTMFIDHVGYIVFDGHSSWFNYVGRLAFPIFAFQISEGYIHTHDVKKYLLRLILFAFISQIPFLLFHSIINNELGLNVIFTLFLGLVAIIIYDKYNKFVGVFSAIIFGIIAHFLNSDYSFYGVGITFLFYVFNKNKCLLAISFIIATLMQYSYLILVYYNYGFEFLKNVFIIYLPYFICTIFSIIIILCYNKKKGPSTKYFFYLFYPLHMILIYILSFVLQN